MTHPRDGVTATGGTSSSSDGGNAAVRSAARRIRGLIRPTPLFDVGEVSGANVRLKLETFQLAGSFKIRGALNSLLAAPPGTSSVVAASGGNHGIAVATAAAQSRLSSTIYVPTAASPTKAARIERAGATLIRVPGSFLDADRLAREHATADGALYVHPFDDPDVVAGQGTVGLEIVSAWSDVDLVVASVGGGGLAAGLVQSAAGRFEVVAAEPELCPTLAASRSAGEPVTVDVAGVAADALGAPRLGEIAWQTLGRADVDPVLVSDAAILAAQRELWLEWRIAAEPAAACAWAALGALDAERLVGRNVAVVICGANLEPRGVPDR